MKHYFHYVLRLSQDRQGRIELSNLMLKWFLWRKRSLVLLQAEVEMFYNDAPAQWQIKLN